MAKDTVRLSLDLSPAADARLEALATKMHTSKAEVLRKAIALTEIAVAAKEQGQKFGVTDSADKLTREIIGL